MIDPQVFSAELALHDGLDDAQVLEALNAPSILVWRELAKSDVFNYLQNHGLWLKLRGVTMQPTPSAVDGVIPNSGGLTARLVAQSAVDLFASDLPTVNGQNGTVQGMIAILKGAGVFSAPEVEAFWAQFQSRISRIEQLVGPGSVASAQDIQAARLYPKYLQSLTFEQAARESLLMLSGAVTDLRAGVDRDLSEWEVE